MRLKDVAMLTVLLGCVSMPAWAQTAEDIRVWDEARARELKRLPKVVRSYAESIGCRVAIEPTNVLRWDGPPEVKYIALISIDAGCAGGSRSSRSIFVAVREGAGGKLYVHGTYSLPELTSMRFPRWMDSISSTKHGIRFAGRVMRADDPDNKPSRRVSGTVGWSGQGWVVLDGECAVNGC
jgi:hypothetical protein